MPVDSRDKRAGAVGRHTAPMYPLPDGTIDAEDRGMVAGVYPMPLTATTEPADTIETVLYSILTADVGVSSLIATRLYPLIIPQGVNMPAMTYQKISGQWQIQMSGPHNMSRERFQFNCWAKTYSETRALAEAVRDLLNGYDSTVDTVKIHVATLDNEFDVVEETGDVRLARRYGRMMDFIIWYKYL
jgi:hypothetical protein